MPNLIRHMIETDFTLEVIPDSVNGGSGTIYCWSDAKSARKKADLQSHKLIDWSAEHGGTWKKRVDIKKPAFLSAFQSVTQTWSDPVLIISEIDQ